VVPLAVPAAGTPTTPADPVRESLPDADPRATRAVGDPTTWRAPADPQRPFEPKARPPAADVAWEFVRADGAPAEPPAAAPAGALPAAAPSAPSAPSPARDDRAPARLHDSPLAALAAALAPAPVAPATTAPATTIDASAFAPALAEQVVRLVHLKMDRVELAVHPAELGPIELKVTMTGADANVVVIAVHPEARAALEQSLPDLRSLLQGAGVALGEASVRDGGTQRDAPRAGEAAAREPARAAPADDAPIAVVRRRGLVDLYA
jgi:flagellar hook-length control protein FliK